MFRGGVLVALSVLVSPVWAQESGAQSSTAGPAFEVASVKPHKDMRPLTTIDLTFLQRVGQSSSNGRFNMAGVPLTVLIALAYNVKESQVTGWPSWANSDGYDIAAKAEGDATFEQMRPMLRALLVERFRLTLRREARESPIYELVAAKSGLRLVAEKEGDCVQPNATFPPALPKPGQPPARLNICGGVRRQMMSPPPERRDRIEAVGMSMPKLAELLSNEVSRDVVDKTGFRETFDFTLEFAPEEAVGAAGSSSPTIFAALQEQLGLRLQPAKGTVEVLVIDHVDKPSAN